MLSPTPHAKRSTFYIPQDRPVYRVENPRGFFGPDDILHPQGSVLYFDDEPSIDMEPMNDIATARKLELLKKLDDCGRQVAAATGKAYNSLADALQNARSLAQQSGSILRLGEEEAVPLLGKRKSGRPKIEKIQPTEGPEEIVETKRKTVGPT